MHRQTCRHSKQCNDEHRYDLPWTFCWFKDGGITLPTAQHIGNPLAWCCCILTGNCNGRTHCKAHEQARSKASCQSSHWKRRCLSRPNGCKGFQQGWSGSRSSEFPSHARNGSKRIWRHWKRCCSRRPSCLRSYHGTSHQWCKTCSRPSRLIWSLQDCTKAVAVMRQPFFALQALHEKLCVLLYALRLARPIEPTELMEGNDTEMQRERSYEYGLPQLSTT